MYLNCNGISHEVSFFVVKNRISGGLKSYLNLEWIRGLGPCPDELKEF